MYQTDRESDLATAEDREKKIGIGLDMGVNSQNFEIAKNMLSEALQMDIIVRCTGFTNCEIEEL